MNIFTKKITSKVSNIADNIKHDMAIRDLENKKQTLQRAVQNEIMEIQNQVFQKNTELGVFTYELYSKDKFNKEAFTERIENINKLNQEIEDKKIKISEIGQRYDEEIAMIKKLQNSELPANHSFQSISSANNPALVCASCKSPYAPGQDAFCKNCGNKLPAQIENSANDSKSLCANCKNPYAPGEDVFCKNCGNKL